MHFQVISHQGACGKTRVVPHDCRPKGQYLRKRGSPEVRVLLSTWGSRGDIEPLAGLAVGLRELGAEVRVCAPPDDDFVALLARAGVPLVPLGPSVRSIVAGPKPPSAKDAFRLAPALVAARFETLTAAAEGCDVLLATGLMPAGARDVAEKLGIRYVLRVLPHRRPAVAALRPRGPAGHAVPGGRDRQQVLWEQDAQRVNALYGEALNGHRAAIGLPPVDNVRDHVLTDRPWLAADPSLWPSQGMTNLDIVQTGAWILPDDRPLPRRAGGVPGRGRPHRCTWASAAWPRTPRRTSPVSPSRRAARRAAACSSPAAGPAWPRSTTPTTASSSARSTSRPCSPAGRRRPPRRRGHHDDGRPGRRAPGGGPPDRGPAALGRPGGRTGHRRGPRRPGPDRRLPVRRAQDGPDP